MRRPVFVALIGLLVIAVAGCTGSQRLQHNSPQEAYQKGQELYEEGEYEDAIRYFRAVFSYGRATEVSADAQLMLARSYRDDGQYRMAATEYRRFVQLYRNDPRVADAEFERAMCYYELSPRYQLDQTETERALSRFQLFVSRYPQHERVPEAEEKIQELREKLAHKKIDAAELYERRGMYRAAALTYEATFDQYPETSWADNALLGAVRSYIEYSNQSVEQRQAERMQKAIDHYDRLVQLFPDSPLLKQAEPLYERAQRRMEQIRERESLADSTNE